MEGFEIIASQTPGVITFSNYEDIKRAVLEYACNFENIDYSLVGINEAEKNLKEIKARKDAITKVKKEINLAYSAPYVELEKKLDELTSILDAPLKEAKSYVDAEAKKEKEKAIYEYATRKAESLGDTGKKVIDSKVFLNPKWLNKSTSIKSIFDEIDSIINKASNDISIIKSTGGEQSNILLARYYETLSLDGMDVFIDNMHTELSDDSAFELDDDSIRGYKILKITATEDQMAFIMSQLKLLGVDVEEIEDAMPKDMEELTEPEFSSFVAFDIETTGTNGVANGDDEAKITEIGAVKVENGIITATFDELANPGRKIVPHIARLTHITDEMVADKPPVNEVIKKFKEFVGDSVLVGHNIKSSDLRYISKAAKLAGIKFDNAFLDTYILAKKYKENMGWEKLNLSYLAKQYGFEHKEVHRAWSDAEVNSQLYFELKNLNVK